MMSISSVRILSPLVRSMAFHGMRAHARPFMAVQMASIKAQPQFIVASSHQIVRQLGSNAQFENKPAPLTSVLDREIQEETAELNQRLQSDQFPGFSVETDDADVKLTKQVGDSTVKVRFTVSSSLSEWRTEQPESSNQEQEQPEAAYSLLSLPEFQVQITRANKTLELSCYFEQLENDEETGEPDLLEPTFNIDEMVIYEGEPRESEFAVSAEYFREELQEGLFQYLAEFGIDDEFVKNLVSYATNYEKKQYIGLMKRLREFVSK